MSIVSILTTIVPWLVALASVTFAIYMFLRVRPVWAFVAAAPGQDIRLMEDKDGIATFKKVDYNPGDSTINPTDDEYDPVLVPSHEAGINVAGRRLFVCARGVGSVQSLGGAMVANMLTTLGIKNGVSAQDFLKNYDFIIPKEAYTETSDGKIRLHPWKFDENGKMLIDTEPTHAKELSGIAVDLSSATKVAPYSMQSEQLGSIRADAKRRAATDMATSNPIKWISMTIMVLAFVSILIVIFKTALGGGGSGVSIGI